MRQVFHFAAIAILVASACGGSGEEPTAVSAPEPPATTVAPPLGTAPAPATTLPVTTPGTGPGGSSELCTSLTDIEPSSFIVGTDPAGIRDAIEEALAGLQRARDAAPAEIAADVQVVLDAFAGFVSLLEEHDYNLIALGTVAANDPRLMAFEETEFTAAVERIGRFCGVDLAALSDPEPSGQAPPQIPDVLVPDNATATFELGEGSVLISTSSSFQELLDHYTVLLGEPIFADPAQSVALWSLEFDGAPTSVSLAAGESGVDVLIAVGP